MTINEMKANVIRTFGFEHPATLYFFDWCEHEKNLGVIKEAYNDAIDWENDDDEDW